MCCVIRYFKRFHGVTGFSMLLTMDRYTRYYVYQSRVGEIVPVYRTTFRVKWVTV